MNCEKPLIFVSPIKKKSVIKSGYHGYSHKCGILLLEKAFSHIGFDFSESNIVKAENGSRISRAILFISAFLTVTDLL